MTGRDLITASLRLIGVKASGESLTAEEATDGLSALNQLIDSLSNEQLLIYQLKEEMALTLTAGDGSYTLGTSGDITTRPQRIDAALIRDGSTDYPVDIISQAEYVAIPDKSTQSTYPNKLYDDGGYPQRTIKLYPVPSAAKSLLLFTLRPLTQVSTLDTTISLPPGYERMLKYNLAVDLAPEYGRPLDAMVVNIAAESKAVIKRANHRPRYLQIDVPVGSPGLYDIYSGGFRR